MEAFPSQEQLSALLSTLHKELSAAMLHRFLPVSLLLILASAALCMPQGVCGEWVEAEGLKGRRVYALVATRGGVFAATDQGVYRSSDGGSTWHSTGLRTSTYALASTGEGVLLAGTESGVYRSNDYGETWTLIGLKGKRVNALASSDTVIYAGTSEAVYVTPEGATWKPAGLYGNVISLAVQPGNPKVVYAGTAGWGKEPGDLYYSTDGGASWERCWFSNLTSLVTILSFTPLPLLVGVPLIGCVTLRYEVTSILVNPRDPREMYAGTRLVFTCLSLPLIPLEVGGIERSNDSGSSWDLVGVGSLFEFKPVYALALSPNYEWLLVGTREGVFLSTDKANTWFKLSPENVTVLAVAADAEGRIYAGGEYGLAIFRHKVSAASLSVGVSMGERGSLRVSGMLASGDIRLPRKSVRILLNGSEAAVCRTNSTGWYNCTVTLGTGDGSTLNITAYFPGDFCYLHASAQRVLHYVSARTPYSSVEGEGWYDEGSYATIKLTATEVDEGLVTYRFEGWEGLEAGDTVAERGQVRVLVDKPRSLVAVWRADYTRVYALCVFVVTGLLLAIVAIILIIKEARRARTQVETLETL